jgi:hypothetical protein
MHTSFLKLPILLVLSFGCYSLTAQDINIDASKLTKGKIEKSATDFEKGFKLIFLNNKVDPHIEILVTDENGAPKPIKKGIANNEKNKVEISFKFDAPSNKLLVNNISVSSPIQIFYGDKEIAITNVDSVPAPSGNKTQNQPQQTVAGIEIHDAILAKNLYTKSKVDLFALLRTYKKIESNDPDTIKEAWKDNPYIKSLLEDNFFGKTPDKSSVQGGGFSSFISNIGNTDVTTIADGIARFLVKRTKEELNIAFFQHFKDLINKPEFKDAQILFPKTIEKLNAIDQEVYLFENYITTLREAFQQDLSLLLDNMPRVIEDGTFKDYFSAHKNLKYSLLLTLFTGKELLNGTHPGKILETFPQEYINGFDEKNASGAIQTVQLISSSLRARGGNNYWTSLDTIKLLVDKNDDKLIAAKFYLGFLYEKSSTIEFKNNNLSGYLNSIFLNSKKTETDIKAYISFIQEIGIKCHDVESSINEINSKKPDEASIDVYHRMFNSFSDLTEQINKVGKLPGIKVEDTITNQVAKYLEIFRQTNDLALNVARKNYGSSVVNCYNIYLTATGIKEKPTDILSDGDKRKGPNLFIVSASDNKVANENAKKTSEFIKKYGNFMANVVAAKTSEEVAQAIESIALPVGSASIKRHSDWNIALNAYVGIFGGYEHIEGIDDKFKFNTYGITAPIGFAISKGWNWEKSTGWSTSLFLSIIDLGAPVAFRFKDDKTEEIPSIQLKDIVSPGIFLSIGYPKIPVSTNIGWQMGPVLREIDPQYADKASSNYSRLSISFVVDIPILNFYTDRKKD